MFRSGLIDAYNTVDVGLVSGYILEDGTISTSTNDPENMHSKYMTTDLIDGGCAITLKTNSGFKLRWIAFYDYAGKLLNRRETRPQGVGYRYGTDYGRLVPKQYKVRFQIEKDDQQDFVLGDNPIAVFRRTLPEYYQKADKSAIANYAQGRNRIDAMCFAPYYTQAGYYGHSISEGTWHLGVAYGGSSTDGAMIGAFMSVRNYLTQMANKRSLLYSQRYDWRDPDTKNVADLTSSFYNYPSISSKRYLGFVGAVCDTIPSNFFGFRKHINVSYFKNGGTAITLSSVDEIDEKVNVADIIIEEVVRHSTGAVLYCDHIVLISDKLYNNDGELEYIEISELGGTCATSTYRYLTPQGFYDYLNDNQLNTSKNESKKWTIWRTNLSSSLFTVDLSRTEDTEGVIPDEELLLSELNINNDICTFAGDYATLFAGDILYLNVNNYGLVPSHNWDTVIIYKDGVDSPYQTIPITLSLDSDGESRADVDISSYFTTKESTGDYSAIAYDSVSGIESAPTHFKIVYLSHFEYNTRLAYESSGNSNNRCFVYFDKSDNYSYIRAGYVNATENYAGDHTRPTSSSTCPAGYNIIRCTNNVNENGLQISVYYNETDKYQSMPVRTVYSVPNKINKLYSDSYYYPASSSYTLTNGYFNMNTGAINTSSSCKVSRYIPVEAGHTYRFAFKNAGSTKYQNYGTRICFYSDNTEITTDNDTLIGYQIWNNPFRVKGTAITDTDPLAGNGTTSVAADNKYYYCDIPITRSDINYIRVSSKYNNTERSLVDITEYVGECDFIEI